jgi:hypothetical protein
MTHSESVWTMDDRVSFVLAVIERPSGPDWHKRMKENVPIVLIISAVAFAIVLMFWTIYETVYSPISHRVPPAETSNSAR